MKRPILLLLCAAAYLLWVRTLWVHDSFQWQVADRQWVGIGSLHGAICVTYTVTEPRWSATFLRPGYRAWPVGGGGANAPAARWSFAGFEARGATMSHVSGGSLTVPYWAMAVVAAVAGALARRSAMTLRRRRAANQLCTACGYDLRATPDRCPECGEGAKSG